MDYFIAGLNEQKLVQDICKELRGRMLKCKISYFTGGELDINIENKDLTGKTIYIVQSIFNNANDRAMELFLLVDAIRNLGGRDIIAIIPYLGYSRQDKLNRGSAFSLQCLTKLIKASGIKKVITVDLHNAQSIYSFDLPVINLTTALIFKDIIKNRDNTVIVAPDVGATLRAKALADLLDINFIVVQKERTKSRTIKIIDIPDIETITGKDCYLVDDILDTGKTICSVSLELEKFKPKTIYGLISHGLFGDGAMQAIDESCIKKIYITDSVNCSLIKSSKIYTVKLSPIIASFLKLSFNETQF